MSEFLKFAYELLSQVLYNIVQWLAAFVKLLLTGWVEYFLIFRTYFPTLNIPAKILSVLLMLVLIAIPVLIIVLLVRHLIMRHKLKMDKTDNAELYREIGRLNKQVISLVDEKDRISRSEGQCDGRYGAHSVCGALALADDVLPTVGNVTGNVPAAGGVAVAGGNVKLDASESFAEAAATAVVNAKERVEEAQRSQVHRFPKLYAWWMRSTADYVVAGL